MAASERDDHRGPERGVAYALPGGRVAVYADDSQLLDWLDEFLGPGFDRVIPAKDDPTVVVTSDAGVVGAARPYRCVRHTCVFRARSGSGRASRPPGRRNDGHHGLEIRGIYRVEPDIDQVVRDDLAPALVAPR